MLTLVVVGAVSLAVVFVFFLMFLGISDNLGRLRRDSENFHAAMMKLANEIAERLRQSQR
jgi:hypothetical protein